MDLFVPPDNEEAKEGICDWQAKTTSGRGGCCGPAAIAALLHMPVYQIIGMWPGGYKGWGSMKDMQAVLETLHIPVVRMRGMKARKFPRPETGCAIVRIQWLKDDGTEYYWAAATCYTHYVLMLRDDSQAKLDGSKGLWYVFCNGQGWFVADKEEAEYLKLGYVSSYFEIKR